MTKPWWQDRVIYQIYPRSFYDTNNDGIGDIPGIIAKLDYLENLGVGALWLSPVYVSPNRDFGYDVANYCDINPEYGTLADMRQLIREAKRRDIRIIMDLVINHTSDQHPWFQQARDPQSPYRDYYIWQKPKKNLFGQEILPNNWTSFFTGPAWTKDEQSGDYYLHLFSKHQPDLNFRNPQVIEEVKNIMRFWLDMGVAGFRCDVINLIYKESLDDGKRQFLAQGSEHYLSTPGCHRILKELHETVWKPYNAFVFGEIQNGTIETVQEFLHGDELSAALAFEHMALKLGYRADKVKRALTKWQEAIEWNLVFFENHDGLRSVSRFGNDGIYHRESATMLATLLLTLRGTPFIYQGQEIGMTNSPFENIGQMQDVVSLAAFGMLTKFRIPKPIAFKLVMMISRDHARTPMQWTHGANGGFTDGIAWMRINPNHAHINVLKSQSDETSIWSFYRELLQLRQDIETLRYGKVQFLDTPSGVLAYERCDADNRYRIVVNMEGVKRKVSLNLTGDVVASNYNENNYTRVKVLQPFEAIILRIT